MMQKLSDRYEQQALHDTLTSLPNRRGMQQLLGQEIKRHQRTRSAFTLILVDVDKFKEINDTYGHGNGDIVLQRTATLLRQNVRRQDIVCRWGGEEFLMVYLRPENKVLLFWQKKFVIRWQKPASGWNKKK